MFGGMLYGSLKEFEILSYHHAFISAEPAAINKPCYATLGLPDTKDHCIKTMFLLQLANKAVNADENCPDHQSHHEKTAMQHAA